jgi:Fe-S cluster assembly ATPase SufC
MIEHQTIPITKIVSAACRDFMAFSGLHNFEFDDGINSIIGRNASGKSSLITLIYQALTPDTSSRSKGLWFPNNNSEHSLLELKFVANDKPHFLRRVMSGDQTTDLHLYIGEGDDAEFLRDGGVVGYLTKLKPVFMFDAFGISRRDFYSLKSRNKTNNNNNTFSPYRDELIEKVNKILPLTNSRVSKLVKSGTDVIAEYQDGKTISLLGLSGGNNRIIFVLTKILYLLEEIKENNLSTVILIDEIEMGLDRSAIRGLNEAIKAISSQCDCQFMITSRFVAGRVNPIRVNRSSIPRYYRVDMPWIQNPPYPSHFQKFAKLVSWNWKP